MRVIRKANRVGKILISNKMSKSLELVNAIVLRDDELLVINGGQDVVTCGAGCGVGCGGVVARDVWAASL